MSAIRREYNMKIEVEGATSARFELKKQNDGYFITIFITTHRKRVLSYLTVNDVIRKAEIWAA